jgi:hypothetical protein
MKSTKKAAATGASVGGAFGLVLAFCAFALMGGGHGTYRPFILFFAPLAFNIPIGLFGGILLYALYGGVLGAQSRPWRRRVAFIIISVVHYSIFVFAFGLLDDGPDYFEKALRYMPGWVFGSGAVFVAMNIAAFSFAFLSSSDWEQSRLAQCRKCGYDLRCNRSKRCPECGLVIHAPPDDSLSLR